LPIHARGATPDSPLTAGWSGPAGAFVPASPAAIPATCVPWNDVRRSSARFDGGPKPGGGNERATITLGVVHLRPPFGNPGGYEKPVGSKNGLSMSTPSSTMPIFTPVPSAPVASLSAVAPMIAGLRLRLSS
jgi:hypothetical protein